MSSSFPLSLSTLPSPIRIKHQVKRRSFVSPHRESHGDNKATSKESWNNVRSTSKLTKSSLQEKSEELSQLQAAYNRLVKEKERLEEMWLAAQENEGLLESEVYQLKEHLSAMARQLVGREVSGGGREGDGLQADPEEGGSNEEGSLTEIKPGKKELNEWWTISAARLMFGGH